MNLQEQFYQVMSNSRLRNSKAASTRVKEMTNGLLVSKPEVIDLQEYAKSGKAAASVQGINNWRLMTAQTQRPQISEFDTDLRNF